MNMSSVNAVNNNSTGLMSFGKKSAQAPELAVSPRSVMAMCQSCGKCAAPDVDTFVLTVSRAPQK